MAQLKSSSADQVIEWLKEGKKVRPINKTLWVITDTPILKFTYEDGSYEMSNVEQKEEHFDCKWIQLENKKEGLKEISLCGIGNGKWYKGLYLYFNPQCNRTLVKLENGHVADYRLSLTDFIYNEFEVIEAVDTLPPLKMTMKEINLHFGRPVEIIK